MELDRGDFWEKAAPYMEWLGSSLPEDRLDKLKSFSKKLSVNFKQISILDQALTHPSYAHEHSKKNNLIDSNQRLEFLGDAILGAVITQYLFTEYEDHNEGKLSKLRSVVVSRRVLAKIAKSLGVGEYLKLGKGELNTKAYLVASVLEDAMESIIAAVYLDQGRRVVSRFILNHFRDEIDYITSREDQLNYKSMLQEEIQKQFKLVPTYKVDKKEGPEHKTYFYVSVSLGDTVIAKGSGYSKKDAEFICAKNALVNGGLNNIKLTLKK